MSSPKDLSTRLEIKLIAGCLAVLLLASCGKHESSIKARLGHAKHFDIPIPLTFKQTSSTSAEQAHQLKDHLVFKGSMSLSQTLDFYSREMEKSGWEVTNLSSRTEGFLFCQKPTKECGISIRSSGGSTTVNFFVKHLSSDL